MPEGTIVGGNPVRITGKLETIMEKRRKLSFLTKRMGIKDRGVFL